MATIAEPRPTGAQDDRLFFLTMAILMALTATSGFVKRLALGLSTFDSPPLLHAHALVFFGWLVIYVTQNALVASERRELHRLLGWLATAWIVPMIVLGIAVTIAVARRGAVPPAFEPAYFLIMDPMIVLTFAGLTWAAVALRRRTDWHRRLHYCAMAFLIAPGIGRLLPLPLLVPWAAWVVFAFLMVFPLIGVAADLRRTGRVHPAWWWGMGVMLAAQLAMDVISVSPVGAAVYDATVAGFPGESIDPYAYPALPLR